MVLGIGITGILNMITDVANLVMRAVISCPINTFHLKRLKMW